MSIGSRVAIFLHTVKYLIDANVLSEPTKAAPQPNVVEWLRRNEREIAIDPVILGELRFGILLLPKGRRRASLERWFDAGVQRLLCLPWDAATGLRWGQLLADLRAKGRATPIKDSLIAATALVHDLAVATRNRTGFDKAVSRSSIPLPGKSMNLAPRASGPSRRGPPRRWRSGSPRDSGVCCERFRAVSLSPRSTPVFLEPIYEWARRNDFPEEAGHIIIAGVPVQIIPAHNALAEEAIASAAELDYEGQPVRVIRPEYLIALYPEPSARTRKRLERVAALLEESNLDRELLQTVLARYNLRLPTYE